MYSAGCPVGLTDCGCLRIGLIDDAETDRSLGLAGFGPELSKRQAFAAFAGVSAFEAAWAEQGPPQLLFVDYFLGAQHGHEVIEFVLQRCPQRLHRPLLIAHSSQDRANRALLALGADLALSKVKGLPATAIQALLPRSRRC